jgi:hypothetical protein
MITRPVFGAPVVLEASVQHLEVMRHEKMIEEPRLATVDVRRRAAARMQREPSVAQLRVAT